MFRKIIILMAACGLIPAAVQATPFHDTWERPVGFIATDAYTPAPHAFLAFCHRHPADCAPDTTGRAVTLNTQRMRELNTVNMDVNDTYTYGMDLRGHDNWDYPKDGYADCEDYALEKRKRLMALGWPASALLLTLAEQPKEQLDAWKYHVVLTVRTLQGDYVLDDSIRPAVSWDKAAELYRFLAMQSPQDPKIWMKVDTARDAAIDSSPALR